jgi:hypothetical protein
MALAGSPAAIWPAPSTPPGATGAGRSFAGAVDGPVLTAIVGASEELVPFELDDVGVKRLSPSLGSKP